MQMIKKWIIKFWTWLSPEAKSKLLDMSEIKPSKFEIYKGGGGMTRWRLVDSEGNVRGRCTGNPRAASLVTVMYLRILREKLPDLKIIPPLDWYFEYYQGKKDNKYYWRLIHQSEKRLDYIAVGGEGFETEEEVIEDIEEFKILGFNAIIRNDKEDSCKEANTTTDQET